MLRRPLDRVRRLITSLIVGLAIGTLLLAGASAADAATAPSPWLQTGYNAAGSNANLAEKTLSTANVAKLHLVRTVKPRGQNGCSAGIDAAAFSDSRIYTTDNDTVSAFNASNGAVIWSTPNIALDDNVFSHIAVSHGLVIVSGNECGTSDPEAYVIALNSTTGKQVWSHSYGDGISGMEVSGSYVVAHVQAGVETDPLTAVYRIANGSVAWTTAGQEAAYCDAQLHVVYGLVYANYCSGGKTSLRALALATGKVVWSKSGDYTVVGGDLDTTAAHHLYLSDNSGNSTGVLDVNPKSGATRFTLAQSGTFIAADAGRVYLTCAGKEEPVCGYDIATGKQQWSNANGDPGLRGGAEANGVLYLGDGNVLNAAIGKYLRSIPGTVELVGNGRVGSVTTSGNLAVYGT